jgi:hypothetical protein
VSIAKSHSLCKAILYSFRTCVKLRWLGYSEEFRQHVAYSRYNQVLQDVVRPARVELKAVQMYKIYNGRTEQRQRLFYVSFFTSLVWTILLRAQTIQSLHQWMVFAIDPLIIIVMASPIAAFLKRV